MLHLKSKKFIKKGGAQLMVLNTIMVPVGSISIVKGAFDSRSAPAHR
jgi:hypothetical protein